MDAKNKICLMLATFFVLLLPSLCVPEVQANWWNNYGPVPPVPDPDPPVPADGSNGNNTSDPLPIIPTVPTFIKDSYLIAVCAIAGDLTSDCVRKTVGEASLKLGGVFISSYLKGNLSNSFRLFVPNLYYLQLNLELLRLIETTTIAAVQAQLENDLTKKLQPFYWPTGLTKAQALLIIREDEATIKRWNREAREEAKKGTNWSHNWNGNGNSSYDFHPGPAYEQLKTISSLGWPNR